MDVINGNFVNVGDNLVQSHPETTVQRFSWVTPGNGYAMNSGLSSTGTFSNSEQDLNIKAEDITGRTSDGYIPHIFLASSSRGNKFTVTVNWGDGTEETYESASIYYQKYYYGDTTDHELYSTSSTSAEIILFSPMLDDTLRGAIQSNYPTVNGVRRLCDYWYCTSDGEKYQGIPNHQYEDDRQYNVLVTVNEDVDIVTFRIATMPNIGWPVLEFPNLTTLVYYYLYNRSSIPFSNFTYLSGLTSLTLNCMNDELDSLPDSLFNMTQLTSLTMYDMPSSSRSGEYTDWWQELDMSRISKLTNLRTLCLRNSYLYYYPEELQNLPLTSVVFGVNSSFTSYPNRTTDFSRVTRFTSSSSTISITEGCAWSGDRTVDTQAREEVYSNYLGELTQDVSRVTFNATGYIAGNFRSSTYLNMEYPEIPEWFDRFISETRFFFNKCFYRQTQTDSLVERIYEATIKHPMSSTTEDGNRNPWYSLYNEANSATYNNVRPSGTLQAPEGFVQGSENGSPASPLEMIYVLTHNYGQTWAIMDETSTNSLSLLSSDDRIKNVPDKWLLAQNHEGNYLKISPNTQLLGHITNVIEFDSEEEILSYASENPSLNIINLND